MMRTGGVENGQRGLTPIIQNVYGPGWVCKNRISPRHLRWGMESRCKSVILLLLDFRAHRGSPHFQGTTFLREFDTTKLGGCQPAKHKGTTCRWRSRRGSTRCKSSTSGCPSASKTSPPKSWSETIPKLVKEGKDDWWGFFTWKSSGNDVMLVVSAGSSRGK